MILIDAESLINSLKELADLEWNKDCFVSWSDAYDEFAYMLEEASSSLKNDSETTKKVSFVCDKNIQ